MKPRKAMRDSSGQDLVLVEYALLASVVALSVTALMVTLRNQLNSEFSSINSSILNRSSEISAFIRNQMRPASGAFFVPSPLVREEAAEAILEIAPPTVDAKQLELELRERAKRAGVSASDSITIATRMVANLVADRKVSITPKDPLDRAIVPGERTRWRWNVTPERGDTITLTATLTAPVTIDGKETGYEVTSFEKTVTVKVTMRQRITEYAGVADDNKWLLGLLGAALLALGMETETTVQSCKESRAHQEPLQRWRLESSF